MALWNGKLIEQLGVEVAAVPVNTTGAAVVGDYYSLKLYNHITFIIVQGAWAGGTPAVTLHQATNVAAAGEKALAFTEYFSQTGLTGTGYAHTAVVSSTFNLTAVANIITVIEVEASDLDINNGFDCVRLGIASPGATRTSSPWWPSCRSRPTASSLLMMPR